MSNYLVTVKTGDRANSGTNAKVYIQINGPNSSTGDRRLDSNEDDFERGSKRTYILRNLIDLDIKSIYIGHDNSGDKPGWFLDYITVVKEGVRRAYHFQCNNWLAKDEGDGRIRRLLHESRFTFGFGSGDHGDDEFYDESQDVPANELYQSRYDVALADLKVLATSSVVGSSVSYSRLAQALATSEVREEFARQVYEERILSRTISFDDISLGMSPVVFEFIATGSRISFLPWLLVGMLDDKSGKILELFEFHTTVESIVGDSPILFRKFATASSNETFEKVGLPAWFRTI